MVRDGRNMSLTFLPQGDKLFCPFHFLAVFYDFLTSLYFIYVLRDIEQKNCKMPNFLASSASISQIPHPQLSATKFLPCLRGAQYYQCLGAALTRNPGLAK